MTRIRFKGFGSSPSQPRFGTPLERHKFGPVTRTCQCKSEDVRPRACDPGASRRMGTVIFLPGLSSQTAEQTPRQTRTYAIRGRLSAGVRRAAADARDATGVAREVSHARRSTLHPPVMTGNRACRRPISEPKRQGQQRLPEFRVDRVIDLAGRPEHHIGVIFG